MRLATGGIRTFTVLAFCLIARAFSSWAIGVVLTPQGETVAGGQYFAAGIKTDGSIVAWGDNSRGQLNVPAFNDFVAISCGSDHSLGMRADRTVVTWGSDTHGQLSIPAGLGPVRAIATGGYHSLALMMDGTVKAWGAGRTGVPDVYNYGQANVPPGLNNVVAITAGEFHSLALRA